jgi:hypothetical protein
MCLRLVIFSTIFLAGTIVCEVPLCSENCPVNEIYTRCSPEHLQSTCWSEAPFADFNSCMPGCVCNYGFLRDPNTYQCIPKDRCPPKPKEGVCPRNEKWSECGFGCDETCGFTTRDLTCRSCVSGCICQNGFVRSLITGQCVPRSDCRTCPPGYSINPITKICNFCCRDCPEFETFNQCGSLCGKTCDNPTGEGIVCAAVCNPQCDCIPGYMRSTKTNRCILKSACPSATIICPRNQIFKECGSICEQTCAKVTSVASNCKTCFSGCFCKPGFIRNSKNECVLSTNCF